MHAQCFFAHETSLIARLPPCRRCTVITPALLAEEERASIIQRWRARGRVDAVSFCDGSTDVRSFLEGASTLNAGVLCAFLEVMSSGLMLAALKVLQG